jgi:hypothetical protein
MTKEVIMTVNATKKRTVKAASHNNFMGGDSFSITPLRRLETMAASCFFGEPMYYAGQRSRQRLTGERASDSLKLSTAQIKILNDELNLIDPEYAELRALKPNERMERAIDEALAYDFEGTLKVAIRLRSEAHIRVTPQVIVVRAAHHANAKGNARFGELALAVIQRMDEPATQLAYQLAAFGRKVPTRLKRLWAKALEGASEFQLAKYKLEAKTVKTVDVVNLCHANSPAIDKLMRGELQLGNDHETWESIVSAGGSFDQAFPVMGHMALLRNLRNLCEKSSVDQREIGEKLLATRQGARQLPFRYWSAYQALNEAKAAKKSLLGDVERCMDEALDQLPKFSGRVISICDNSGSAQNAFSSEYGSVKVSTIANLTGAMTALLADEGEVGIFGDRLKTLKVTKNQSIFDIVEQMEKNAKGIGQGTEHGIWLFWDKAIQQKIHYDAVFVYSDMQAGHGGLYGTGGYAEYRWGHNHINVPKLIAKYRQEVNQDVKVFLVQVAGYEDTIMPEQYKNTYILGGWSDAVLRYAHAVINQK